MAQLMVAQEIVCTLGRVKLRCSSTNFLTSIGKLTKLGLNFYLLALLNSEERNIEMKRSELEKDLATKFNLQIEQSEQIIDAIINHMTEVLQDEDRIEIRGFGSFFTKGYKPYSGRNPRTGEIVDVPPKRLPHFRPSKELIQKLNEE